jgi:hypothetical protein
MVVTIQALGGTNLHATCRFDLPWPESGLREGFDVLGKGSVVPDREVTLDR